MKNIYCFYCSCSPNNYLFRKLDAKIFSSRVDQLPELEKKSWVAKSLKQLQEEIEVKSLKEITLEDTINILEQVKDKKWGKNSPSNSPKYVFALQAGLHFLGYNPGKIDGGWGEITKGSLKEFQKAHLNGGNGWPGPRTIKKLLEELREIPAEKAPPTILPSESKPVKKTTPFVPKEKPTKKSKKTKAGPFTFIPKLPPPLPKLKKDPAEIITVMEETLQKNPISIKKPETTEAEILSALNDKDNGNKFTLSGPIEKGGKDISIILQNKTGKKITSIKIGGHLIHLEMESGWLEHDDKATFHVMIDKNGEGQAVIRNSSDQDFLNRYSIDFRDKTITIRKKGKIALNIPEKIETEEETFPEKLLCDIIPVEGDDPKIGRLLRVKLSPNDQDILLNAAGNNFSLNFDGEILEIFQEKIDPETGKISSRKKLEEARIGVSKNSGWKSALVGILRDELKKQPKTREIAKHSEEKSS